MAEALYHHVDDEHQRDTCRKGPAHLKRVVSPSHLGKQFHHNDREDDASCEVLDAASNDAAGRAQGGNRRAKERGDDGNCRDKEDLKNAREHVDWR